jgi:hypothetical protein
MDDPLDIQYALQPRPSFGIKVLTPTIGTATSPQGRILGLIMIRMHLCHGTNRGKGMFWVNPDYTPLTLRAFDFHRHFQAFSPDFADAVTTGTIAERQIDTSQVPQRFGVAPFTVSEPANKRAGLRPLPRLLRSPLKQQFVLMARHCRDPVTTITLDKVDRPTF